MLFISWTVVVALSFMCERCCVKTHLVHDHVDHMISCVFADPRTRTIGEARITDPNGTIGTATIPSGTATNGKAKVRSAVRFALTFSAHRSMFGGTLC